MTDGKVTCGLEGDTLEWYLRCNGQPLVLRILPLVLDRSIEMSLRAGGRLDPLEAMLDFLNEWPVMSFMSRVRFLVWWETENKRIIERDRLRYLAEKQERQHPQGVGAPGARGRARGKPRNKAGRR